MMALCRAAIGISGGCWNTTFPQRTPHNAAMDDIFSMIDPMRTKRAPTGSVERVPGPFQEHWR